MKEKLPVNAEVLVTNIQRFSLHDGPGIRTTIFLKGCSLRCPWCSNPENISLVIEPYKKDGINTTIGQYMSCDELYDIIMKDKVFYEGGGVTFSGGEALLQAEAIKPLLERLKQDNIHLCVETALVIPQKKLEEVIRYFDLFYVDIKILSKDWAYKILGADIDLYIRNVDFLINEGKTIIFRFPIISQYTFSQENIVQIIEFLKARAINYVELIAEHHLGNSKYEALGKASPKLHGIVMEDMEKCKKYFEQNGISAIICTV